MVYQGEVGGKFVAVAGRRLGSRPALGRIFLPGRLRNFFFLLVFFSVYVVAAQGFAQQPVATDSRIKTFIYSPSEVFPLVVHYGYQPSIEFATGEEVEVVSMGKSYAWEFESTGGRLFLKPLEPDSHTNMTVITNKRTYQFDLWSRNPEEGADEELIYVVRFYYPDVDMDGPRPVVDTRRFIPNVAVEKGAAPGYNFNYTYTGPDAVAPVKLFDDGKDTYFSFSNNNAILPHIFLLDEEGKESQLSYRRKGEFIVVDGIKKRFILRLGQDMVCIFNESLGG